MLKKSNIQKIDFSKLYREQKEISTFKLKSAKDWDEKAIPMNGRVFKSIYVEDFLKKVDLKGAKSLLDVGCGPGTFGISLAKELEDVYCLDFSQKMLECVEENAKTRGLKNVHTLQKSFTDDWSDVPKVDVLIASRCLEVEDLEDTLKLINSKAKRVYLTYKIGGTFVDEDILNQIGEVVEPKPDFIYLINILYQMGIAAKMDFVRSENRRFVCKNAQDFIEKVKWSMGEITKKDEENLTKFYEKSYKHKSHEKYLNWAFISYET